MAKELEQSLGQHATDATPNLHSHSMAVSSMAMNAHRASRLPFWAAPAEEQQLPLNYCKKPCEADITRLVVQSRRKGLPHSCEGLPCEEVKVRSHLLISITTSLPVRRCRGCECL